MKKATSLLVLLAVASLAFAANMELTSARLYKKQGEWLKSLQFYNTSIEKDSENPEAYFERGSLLVDIASNPALKSVQSEIAGDAKNPTVELYSKAMSDFEKVRNSTDKAAKKLQKNLDELLNRSWDSFYFEAVALDTTHEYVNQSKADSRPADSVRAKLKIASADSVRALMEKPSMLLELALEKLDMAIMVKPRGWNAYAMKAQTLDKLKRYDAATPLWEKALEQVPTEKDADQKAQALSVIEGNLLEHYYNSGEYRKSLSFANQLLKTDPANVGAVQIKALSITQLATDTTFTQAEREQMKRDAIEALNELRKQSEGKEDPTVIYYIGQFNLQLGDTAKAIAAFQDYLKVDAEDRDVLFALGVLYLEGGSFADNAKAIETFRLLTEFHADHSASWINYGVALIRAGQTAEGKTAVEKGKSLGGGTGE